MEEHPLFQTKEEALAAPGEIYLHYKGGLYRLLYRDVMHTELQKLGVVYEHIWPHNHGVYFRPQEMFFGKTDDGIVRFKLIKDR